MNIVNQSLVKDGEKGPATPVFGWYGGNKFMVEPPFDKMGAGAKPAGPANKVSEVDAGQLENDATETEDFEEESGFEEFGEEEAGTDEIDEDELESLPPEADKREDAGPLPGSAEKQAGAKEPDSEKWEKDWWDEI